MSQSVRQCISRLLCYWSAIDHVCVVIELARSEVWRPLSFSRRTVTTDRARCHAPGPVSHSLDYVVLRNSDQLFRRNFGCFGQLFAHIMPCPYCRVSERLQGGPIKCTIMQDWLCTCFISFDWECNIIDECYLWNLFTNTCKVLDYKNLNFSIYIFIYLFNMKFVQQYTEKIR